MAQKKYYIGSTGPLLYDPEKPLPGSNIKQAPLVVEDFQGGQFVLGFDENGRLVEKELEIDLEGVIRASDFTAKGQLLAATAPGAYTVLNPGAAGELLIPDSEAEAGLRWSPLAEGVLSLSKYGLIFLSGDITFAADETSYTLTDFPYPIAGGSVQATPSSSLGAASFVYAYIDSETGTLTIALDAMPTVPVTINWVVFVPGKNPLLPPEPEPEGDMFDILYVPVGIELVDEGFADDFEPLYIIDP